MCYKCWGYGHIAKDCPSPQVNTLNEDEYWWYDEGNWDQDNANVDEVQRSSQEDQSEPGAEPSGWGVESTCLLEGEFSLVEEEAKPTGNPHANLYQERKVRNTKGKLVKKKILIP